MVSVRVLLATWQVRSSRLLPPKINTLLTVPGGEGGMVSWLSSWRFRDTPTNVGTTNVGNDQHRNEKRQKI